VPDHNDDAAGWSQLTVAQVRQQSRLVASRSLQPLKITNPAVPAGAACHAVLASYGGGLVAGGCMRLRVRCEAGSWLLLSTQANTRIFKSIDGQQAEQLTEGHVADHVLAVVLPDPLVPQTAAATSRLSTGTWPPRPPCCWPTGTTPAAPMWANSLPLPPSPPSCA